MTDEKGSRFDTLLGWVMGLGVVGLLVAVGVPNYLAMRNRSRIAAGIAHLDSIRQLELAYEADHGHFVSLPRCPADVPDGVLAPFEGPCARAWETIGFAPQDLVRCRFEARVEADAPSPPDFDARALCDGIISGPSPPRQYTANRSEKAQMVTEGTIYDGMYW